MLADVAAASVVCSENMLPKRSVLRKQCRDTNRNIKRLCTADIESEV